MAQPTVGGTILAGNLGLYREQAEQARGGELVNSIPPGPLLQFRLQVSTFYLGFPYGGLT